MFMVDNVYEILKTKITSGTSFLTVTLIAHSITRILFVPSVKSSTKAVS